MKGVEDELIDCTVGRRIVAIWRDQKRNLTAMIPGLTKSINPMLATRIEVEKPIPNRDAVFVSLDCDGG